MNTSTVVRRICAQVLFVAGAIGLAGCQGPIPAGPLNTSASIAEPGLRCAPGAVTSDEAVAAAIGMDTDRLDRLRNVRSLSNNDICTMPTRLLKRAMLKAESPKPDHPGEWASFRALRQTDEAGNVKPDGLIKAIQQRQAMLLAQTAVGSDKSPLAGISPMGWSAIGPGNIGGRLRSILIHPTQTNKMWIGSVGGGIWTSADNGASWAPVNDFMGNLSVSSLVMDPTNSNVMYAGTGEGFFNGDAIRGAGVFKSADGGVTWAQLASTNPVSASQWYYINRLAIHPTNGNIILAATGNGLYRTADGGASWVWVASGGANGALDVRFNPNDGNNAIVGWNDGQVSYSSSAGSSWTPVTLAAGGGFYGRVELSYAPSSFNTAYAVVGGASNCTTTCGALYVSSNGGATWSFVSYPNHLGSQSWYSTALWVNPVAANHLIVGGLDLWQSTNSGASWTKISQWYSQPQSPHADHHVIVSAPGYNGSSNRTIFFGNDGGVYKAQDIAAVTGVTTGWTVLNNGLGITQFYGGAGKAAAGGRIIGGTQDNGSLKLSSGTSWGTVFGGDGGFAAADSLDDNYLYGEYVHLAIHRSTNGGATQASYICSGITEALGGSGSCGAGATSEANFIAPFILDPNNNNRMLAGARSLWVSDNVKATTPSWTAIKPPSGSGSSFYISAISVVEGNSNIIWVGHNNGQVYFTTNGTAPSPTWTLVSGLPGRMVLRILVDKSDTNRVYVSFGGFSAGNLQLTTNGGASWTSISGTLPNVPIGSIVRHPTNASWIYAGTEVGVFTSENGGSTWNTTNDGPANVAVDELFWYDNSRLVAVTHGRGMFMTTIGGAGASNTLTVAKSGNGAGSVASNLAGITCGAACSAVFVAGTSVVLTATPIAGSSFIGWSGACSGTATCTVTMNNPILVTARFDLTDDGFPGGAAIPANWVHPAGSTAPWVVTNDSAYAGSLSLRSGIISHSQKSEISYTADFAAGNVSFARKVSSEGSFDYLRFYIDGVQQMQWSGELGWQTFSYPLSAGTHTLRWSYEKDSSVDVNSDAAWIDAVVLPALNCTYVLSPTSRSVASAATTGTVSVTVQPGCPWSANSGANWLGITSGGSGNGIGTLAYSVAANTGNSSRIGSLTIAGQTFTLTQNRISKGNVGSILLLLLD